jgi:hypothetical protein
MAKDQRKIKNLVSTAGLRHGHYMYVFAGGVAFLGITMFYVVHLLGQVQASLASIPDMALAGLLQEHLLTIALLFFVSFFIFICTTVYFMVILGNRVGGAVVAICKYIEELKQGNYSAKRSLRRNDELIVIMDGLKDLAESLRRSQT